MSAEGYDALTFQKPFLVDANTGEKNGGRISVWVGR
jgi:hypothetical protein